MQYNTIHSDDIAHTDDIAPEMLKPGRVTKGKVFFPVLVQAFNIDLFEFSATILEKALLRADNRSYSTRIEGKFAEKKHNFL